jgi:hypothetical protein
VLSITPVAIGEQLAVEHRLQVDVDIGAAYQGNVLAVGDPGQHVGGQQAADDADGGEDLAGGDGGRHWLAPGSVDTEASWRR